MLLSLQYVTMFTRILWLFGYFTYKGNGVVEMPEFVDLISQLRQPSGRSVPPSESELSEAMKGVFDHDRDGYMSAAEFRHVLTTTGEKLMDEELDLIINRFQPNGDGLVRCQGRRRRRLNSRFY